MCSSRGKLCEGLNFKDNLARAIFVVGIPYQLVSDARVIMKQHYLANSSKLSSSEWSQMAAMREVNQIIGRSLRHGEDYSCIFLVDQRYTEKHHFQRLSKWVRQNKIKVTQNYDLLEEEVKAFFRANASIKDESVDIQSADLRSSEESVIDISSQPSLEVAGQQDEEIQYIELESESSSLPLPNLSQLSEPSFTQQDLKALQDYLEEHEGPIIGRKRPAEEPLEYDYLAYKRS